jgi:hypothetical protein
LLTLQFQNPPEKINFKKLFEDYELQIRKSLISEILRGLHEDLDRVTFLVVEPQGIDFTCERDDYEESLIENLPKLEEAEEYELCARIRDALKIKSNL